jgi:hypothetical protein
MDGVSAPAVIQVSCIHIMSKFSLSTINMSFIYVNPCIFILPIFMPSVNHIFDGFVFLLGFLLDPFVRGHFVGVCVIFIPFLYLGCVLIAGLTVHHTLSWFSISPSLLRLSDSFFPFPTPFSFPYSPQIPTPVGCITPYSIVSLGCSFPTFPPFPVLIGKCTAALFLPFVHMLSIVILDLSVRMSGVVECITFALAPLVFPFLPGSVSTDLIPFVIYVGWVSWFGCVVGCGILPPNWLLWFGLFASIVDVPVVSRLGEC